MVNIARPVSSLQVLHMKNMQLTSKDNIYFNEPGAGIAVVSLNYGRQTYNHTAKTSDTAKDIYSESLAKQGIPSSLELCCRPYRLFSSNKVVQMELQ